MRPRLILHFAAALWAALHAGTSAAQCVNMAQPSCSVYESCFAQACACDGSPYEYFRSYGKKYCETFLDLPDLSPKGRTWRDSTLRCLQETIVPHLPDRRAAARCDCRAMHRLAFDSHVACYTQKANSICQLPAADWARITAAVGPVSALVDSDGRRQMLEVARLCIDEAAADARMHVQALIDQLSGLKPTPQAVERLGDHLKLVQACPAPEAVRAVGTLGRHANIQYIQDATSDALRLDDFAVTIGVLPRLPGAKAAATPEDLLEYVRLHLADFFDPQVIAMTLPDSAQAQRWSRRETALGTLLLFTLRVGAAANGDPLNPVAALPVPVEQAMVVTSDLGARSWRFLTVRAGLAAPGEHPVSGAREFGLRTGPNGLLQLYTRGIDRPTSLQDHLLARVLNNGQDLTWQRFTQALAAFVNAQSGVAAVEPGFTATLSWKTDVEAPGRFQDDCHDDDARSARRPPPTPQDAVAAMHMLSNADASGAVKAIAETSLARLAAAGDAATRQQLLDRTAQLIREVDAADSPAALLQVLDSGAGRDFGLVNRTPAWSAEALRFASSPQPLALASAVSGSDGADGALPAAVELASRVSPSDLKQWLSALARRDSASPAEIFSRLVPPVQRALVAQSFELATQPGASEVQLRAAREALLGRATALLGEKGEQVRDTVAQVQRIDAAVRSPKFQQLMRGDPDMRSLSAGADLLALAAGAGGNEALARDVQRASAQVRTAMSLAEGASTLATVGSGGAALVAFGMLSGAGGLDALPGGNADAGSAQLMQAIADLTDLVKTEFAKVNTKLDRMSDTLDQISADLRQLGRLQTQTYEAVSQLRGDFARLLVTMGQFEQDLKQRSLDSDEQPCRRYRQGLLPGPLDAHLFFTCLAAYRDWAGATLAFAPAGGGNLDAALVSQLGGSDFRPGEALWRSAGLVARGAEAYLGLPAAHTFSTDDQARRLASGVFSAAGANHYLLWIDHFGSQHVPPVHAKLVQEDRLATMLQDLQTQQAYRDALRLPPGRRAQVFDQFFSSAKGASTPERAEALESMNARYREAVRDQVLKTVAGTGGAVPRVPALGYVIVATCTPGAGVFGQSVLDAQRLLQEGLPPNLLHFGMQFQGQTTFMPAQRGLRFTLMNDGLELCLDEVHADQTMTSGRIDGRFLTAHVRVRLGQTELCNREAYAEDNRRLVAGPGDPVSFETLSQAVVLKAVKQCFENQTEAERANYFGGLLEAVLTENFPDDTLRLELLAVWGRLLEGQAARDELASVLEPAWARLAFLRAYIALIHPSVWITDDKLRMALNTEYPDTKEALAEGLRCAATLVDHYGTQAPGTDVTRDTVLEDARQQCPGVPFEAVFDNFTPKAPQNYGVDILRWAERPLSRTDWGDGKDVDLSADAWLTRRLQHFIERGAQPAYWEAVSGSAR